MNTTDPDQPPSFYTGRSRRTKRNPEHEARSKKLADEIKEIVESNSEILARSLEEDEPIKIDKK